MSRSARPFTVRRITEELEFEPGLLEFLEASAIQPGNRGTVTAASPDGTLTVEIDGSSHRRRRVRERTHPGHLVRPSRLGTLAATLAAALTFSACADTVVEVESSDAHRRRRIGRSPATTLPIVGSTDELLAEMAADMSQLSAQIAAEGDEQATLRRIEATWVVARPDVESTRP